MEKSSGRLDFLRKIICIFKIKEVPLCSELGNGMNKLIYNQS